MEQDQNSKSNEGASYFHRIKKKELVRSYPTLISDTVFFFFLISSWFSSESFCPQERITRRVSPGAFNYPVFLSQTDLF